MSDDPWRTAFFGTPPAAVPALASLASQTRVELVVTRPDKARGRSGKPRPPAVKEAAMAWGFPLAQPASAVEVADQLAGIDLAVVVAYGQLLPADMLAMPTRGFINVHFSRLPRWRGAAPVARAILAGDETTGVDIIQLDEGMDTGDLIARQQASIRPTDTTGTLTARLAGLGAALLGESLEEILTDGVQATPQGSEGVSLAAKLASQEGRINPGAMSAEQCDRVIRAFNPNPGAWGVLDGERFKVWQAIPSPDTGLDPGQMTIEGESPVVGTADGTLQLLEVQAAGKARMPGAVWARGHRGEFRWE
ncbi:MAG: methionyl-tRNA formyltransferase [Acidimicrobiia bacterium]